VAALLEGDGAGQTGNRDPNGTGKASADIGVGAHDRSAPGGRK